MKTAIASAILVLTLTTGGAHAYNAQSSGAVNLRVGPGVNNARITTIPAAAPLQVHYCLPSPAWCQVTYGATTGWASARYVMPLQAVAPTLRPRVVHVVHLSGAPQAFRIRLHAPIAQQHHYHVQTHTYSGHGYPYAMPVYPVYFGHGY